MQEVEFFFGLGSRYSYLAFTQIARMESTYACTFNLQPIGSGELLKLRGASPFQGALDGRIPPGLQVVPTSHSLD